MTLSADIELGAQICEQRAAIDAMERAYLQLVSQYDSRELWKKQGCSSMTAWLVARTRRDERAAYDDVAIAHRMYGDAENALPIVAARVEAGEMSLDQARAVERGSRSLAPAIMSEVEETVASAASRLGAKELATATKKLSHIEMERRAREDAAAELAAVQAAESAATRQAAVDAVEQRERAAEAERVHREQELESRYLRREDRGRMTYVEGLMARLDADRLFAVIDRFARPANQGTSEEPLPDPRPLKQRWIDALSEVAERCAVSEAMTGSIGGLQVVVPLSDLRGSEGDPTGCELPREQLQRLCCDAEISVTVGEWSKPLDDETMALLNKALTEISPALGGAGFAVLAQGRSKRLVTAAQKRALAVRDRGCVYAGCNRKPHQCEAHHIKEWEDGGTTDLENLALLCSYHHHLLHLRDERLVPNDRGGFDVRAKDKAPPGS